MIQPGSIIGSYRVVQALGEGGMGTVYLAEHSLLGRRAAIKVLKPELSTRPDVIERFFGEARTASTIADPGIVQIFDFGYHPSGCAYILMELLDGEPLDSRLRRLGRVPVVQALRIVRQIASSLAAAHARGIVHRDLKPENVILVRDTEVVGGERAKLLDFGIAKLVDAGAAPRPAGPVMGTPLYMSPEQCRDLADLDHRSDVYSLGCVLFHLLTGHPPFEAGSAVDVLAMHLLEPPPVLSALAPDLSPDLDAFVMCCLAKSPRDRFQSMAELIAGIGLMLPHLRTELPTDCELEPQATGRRASRYTTPHTTIVSSPLGAPASIGRGMTPASTGRRASRRRRWRGPRLAIALAAIAFVGSVSVTTFGMLRVGADRRASQPPPAVDVANEIRHAAPPAAVPDATRPAAARHGLETPTSHGHGDALARSSGN